MSGVKMPLPHEVRERLLSLHRSLMRLHKILLDDERAAYERAHGAVGNPSAMLGLVMSDPFFDWLHAISRLIVRIDEITEDEAASLDRAADLLQDAWSLLGTRGTAGAATELTSLEEFGTRYRAVLQRNSSAVAAHFEVQKLLAPNA